MHGLEKSDVRNTNIYRLSCLNSGGIYKALRGRLIIRGLAVLFAIVIWGCCASSDKSANNDKLSQVRSEFIETTVSFRGWLGKEAILRQEQILDDGDIKTSFFSIRLDGTRRQLNHESWKDKNRNEDELPTDPPGLETGNILVSNFQSQTEETVIMLKVYVNADELTAMEEAIVNWTPDKELPSTNATLMLQRFYSNGEKETTLWDNTIKLGPYFGENGVEYNLPKLIFAALSPAKKVILFELLIEGESNFFMVPWLDDKEFIDSKEKE